MPPVTQFSLNGADVAVHGEPDRPLIDVLRGDFDLFSVRSSCGIGICGTCTVLLDGRAVSACLLLLGMVEGRAVTTTEAQAPEGADLDDVQAAFLEAGAFQCSFCIPAMVLTTASVQREQPDVTADEMTEQLAGNLCRCGSYPQIRAALRSLLDTEESSP